MYKLNDHCRLLCLGALLTAGTVFLACSGANPSEADAIKALDAACRQQQNLCKVKSLHKTDGQASEVSKVSHYRLEYQAEVECLSVNDSGSGVSIFPANTIAICGKVGDVRKVAGVFEFVQSENGWNLTGHQVKHGSAQVGEGAPEITTASGLKYTDLVVGAGATPQKGQTVTVHYTGTLANGIKFDSSYDHPGQEPLEFQLGTPQIIQGWNEGIATMKVGGKRRLTIPSVLGYGPAGRPPSIPGNSTLVFDVELLGVK